MYILKNALVSLTRNKGRNILIGIIIIVIACASTVALAISNSANTLISSYESKNDITATISINRENMMQNFRPGEGGERPNISNISIPSINKEEAENYGSSEYVKSFYYTYSLQVNSSNMEAASMSFGQNDDETNNGNRRMVTGGGIIIGGLGLLGDFNLTGYSSYEAMNEFIEGRYIISDGEVSNDFDGDYCVISEELATLNELSIGDVITLTNPDDEQSIYKLTITGIYTEKETGESDNSLSIFSASVNSIITNTNVIEQILKNNEDLTSQINPTFILTSKDVIDAFTSEVHAKGLDESYQVTTNLESIEGETAPIRNVATFVKTFLIITLIIGGIVLFVLNMINVRERKYEIGVLRTIGMKKSKVASQFALELLTVSILALFIGFGIGSGLSVPVANKLLANEISSQQEENQNISNNFGGNVMFERRGGTNNFGATQIMGGNIDYITKINAVVNMTVLGQLLLIGMGLTLVSSLAAIININKFSPLSILKERG